MEHLDILNYETRLKVTEDQRNAAMNALSIMTANFEIAKKYIEELDAILKIKDDEIAILKQELDNLKSEVPLNKKRSDKKES